jgi:mRNA-degrading endonuclease RelE of RelBE toxin-antitoxin system
MIQEWRTNMNTRIRPSEPHIKLAGPQLPANIRSGGETIPIDYPSLYQIQAGDWRISYAVEHNRLAILVLEVLNAEGQSSKDVVRADLKRKMKIKLLDWPEGAGETSIPPEDLGKKLKIKWLDMGKDGEIIPPENAGASRIKLKSGDVKASPQHKITLLDGTAKPADGGSPDNPVAEGEIVEDVERKVTPLDEPSM